MSFSLGSAGLSVCKWSENFNENSEIILLILLQGTFQYYGKHLPVASKTKMRRENGYIFIAVSLLCSEVE